MEDISSIIRRCKRSNETKLALSGKGLMSIPQDVFNLSQLQSLDLSNNKLTQIDPKISQLRELRQLILNNNSLIELPAELTKLPQLEVLQLSNNPLGFNYECLLQEGNLRQNLAKVFNLSETPLFISEPISKPVMSKQISGQPTQTVTKGGVMEVDANEFEVGEIVSQGGFSIVHRATFRGTEVALKKIFNPNVTPELMAEVENEIEMLATLRHPNIVLLMAVTTKPPNLFIATEFMQRGALFNLLHKTKLQISEPQKLKLAIQIAKVIHYLHLSGIVHRDIKSHNILLDDNFKIRLCDFGLARKVTDLNQGTMQFSGTPTYMAPELFRKKAYDKGVDLFAFGTLLWELFAREVPYEGLDPQDIGARVLKGDPLQPRTIPRSIYQLTVDLRHSESSKRPSMDTVVAALEQVSL